MISSSSASVRKQARSSGLDDRTERQSVGVSPATIAREEGITEEEEEEEDQTTERQQPAFDIGICQSMPDLHEGSRLAKNIQTLLALVDPATLVLENTEDAVSEIEERFRGASLKAKLIQRALGESLEGILDSENSVKALSSKHDGQGRGDGSGSIEDISSLHIRH